MGTCHYTQVAYSGPVRAEFVELPAFARHRAGYLDDDGYRALQWQLMLDPEAGAVMPGTGGLRKIRFADTRRGKGKRGGLRVIYYWWSAGPQFWLFAIYDKDEMTDLSPAERAALRSMVKAEIEARKKP